MIEEIIINFLNTALNAQAYAEIPENTPQSFVIVEKTGGGNTNYVKSATIAIKSYAQSGLWAAAKLNEAVKSAMEDLTELDDIGSVSLNSDYNFTDTATKHYRYQAVYNIIYY